MLDESADLFLEPIDGGKETERLEAREEQRPLNRVDKKLNCSPARWKLINYNQAMIMEFLKDKTKCQMKFPSEKKPGVYIQICIDIYIAEEKQSPHQEDHLKH